jgi:hypothetical protein
MICGGFAVGSSLPIANPDVVNATPRPITTATPAAARAFQLVEQRTIGILPPLLGHGEPAQSLDVEGRPSRVVAATTRAQISDCVCSRRVASSFNQPEGIVNVLTR